MGRFRIIVGEFHSLGFLTFRPFFAFAAAAFNKVLQTHDCVHIHPNNYTSMKTPGIPSSMEFTFLRKDRMRGGGEFADEFPHSLDCDNGQDRPPLILPACWRGGGMKNVGLKKFQHLFRHRLQIFSECNVFGNWNAFLIF